MKMPKSDLDQYKYDVTKRLKELTPFLSNYATGDFTENIEIPDEEDEFTELLVGLSLMIDDVREMIQNQEDTIAKLEGFNRSMVGREKRMIELKGLINGLSLELGRVPPYDLSFAKQDGIDIDEA